MREINPDQVVTGEIRNILTTYKVNLDENWRWSKRGCLNNGVPEVEDVACGSRVWDEGGNGVGIESAKL